MRALTTSSPPPTSSSVEAPSTPLRSAASPVVYPDQVAAPASIASLLGQLQTYLEPQDLDLVRDAHEYAAVAHTGQMRKTGHAYISHPLAVASTLADMRMDHETVIAALLHDVIEDTPIAKQSVSDRFGSSVADIVDGVSKLKTIFQSRAEAQAASFQKMAMAMARDIRVILVKLADRLHNMRTIGVMTREAQQRIAKETLEFYAPIANRLGMNELKNELEELAFRALYPMRSQLIERAVAATRGDREHLVEEVTRALEATLEREGITASVVGREKHLYSIYSKMREQRKSFSQIMDVYAFRVMTDDVDTCYRVLGKVHNLYKPVAGRFKDYIAIPKENGYQSLHTTLFGPNSVHIEIQVRTQAMDAIAANGIASQWLYKQHDSENPERARRWANNLLDLQQQAGDSMEFIEHLKTDLFPDEVYVFTPRGHIMALPPGACPVDFAYAVHTDIGDRCIAARIDRQMQPLSTRLASGQAVEIITGREPHPNPDWLSFVATARARAGIRNRLKHSQRSDSIAMGRKLLNRALVVQNTSIKALDFRRLRKVFNEFGVRRLDDLLAEIGLGNQLAYVVARRLLNRDAPPDASQRDAVAVNTQDDPVMILGSEGMVVSYSRCCRPLPGDAVVGHISAGKGLVVHVETCGNMSDIRRRTPEVMVPVRWSDKASNAEFTTTLSADVRPVKGVIAELASSIAGLDAGIDSIDVAERGAELSRLTLELSVRNRVHVGRILKRLRALPSVTRIARVHS